MKKAIIAISVAVAVVSISMLCNGCAGCEQTMSHLKSGTVGINRNVTLYANDGSVIKTWTGRLNVEDQGGSFRFMANGKAVVVSGTVIIEER